MKQAKQESKITYILGKLQQSTFRNRFHLTQKEKQYVIEKGMPTIEKHAYDFIQTRLAPALLPNDGKQTPMRGHPVFLAQHATATCCRSCLAKWHHIETGRELTQAEQDYVVALIMTWICKESEN